MKIDQIVERLMAIGGEESVLEELDMPGPVVRLPRAALAEAMPYLREAGFDSLMALSGIDYKGMKKLGKEAGDALGVVYHLPSHLHRLKLTVKVWLPRAEPSLPSVAAIWRTADWHEREAFDLFGIVFEGHPDLRRLLLPDDWEGWPLRKDYAMPTEYRGIPHRVEVEEPS